MSTLIDEDTDDDMPLKCRLTQARRPQGPKINLAVKSFGGGDAANLIPATLEGYTNDDVPLAFLRPLAQLQASGKDEAVRTDGVPTLLEEDSEPEIPLAHFSAHIRKLQKRTADEVSITPMVTEDDINDSVPLQRISAPPRTPGQNDPAVAVVTPTKKRMGVTQFARATPKTTEPKRATPKHTQRRSKKIAHKL